MKKYFLIFLILISLFSFSQKKIYKDYPCSFEKWIFINDTILFIKSNYNKFLFIYNIEGNTCKISLCKTKTANLYEEILGVSNLNIIDKGIMTSVMGRNYLKYNPVIIIRKKELLIINSYENEYTLFLLSKNNEIKNLYFKFINRISHIKVCRGYDWVWDFKETKMEKRIINHFDDIIEDLPNYTICW